MLTRGNAEGRPGELVFSVIHIENGIALIAANADIHTQRSGKIAVFPPSEDSVRFEYPSGTRIAKA